MVNHKLPQVAIIRAKAKAKQFLQKSKSFTHKKQFKQKKNWYFHKHFLSTHNLVLCFLIQ
jgi:hypothetical protein